MMMATKSKNFSGDLQSRRSTRQARWKSLEVSAASESSGVRECRLSQKSLRQPSGTHNALPSLPSITTAFSAP